MNTPTALLNTPVPSTDTGKLGLMHLKRLWQKHTPKQLNMPTGNFVNESVLDKITLSVLGLGLEQTFRYLGEQAPTFEQFEEWIIQTSGIPLQEEVVRFNSMLQQKNVGNQNIPAVLTSSQLDFWNENGYIVIKNAISKADCDDTVAAICNYINIDRNDPSTWYNPVPAQQGIMVQLFQHPAILKNRYSPKIRQVFEQLWQRTDIWPSADRVGFNPPETDTYQFQGPDLHWDCSLQLPIPFNLQGILYLSDVAPNQGAFTLVPGFQHRIADWLNSLPENVNPRQENLHALGSKPIAGQAGDMVIWQQALPHGSSPNTHSRPRFVQYLTYHQANYQGQQIWK
jgi:hypothetical protein